MGLPNFLWFFAAQSPPEIFQHRRVAAIPDVPEDGVVDVARGVLAIEGIRQTGTEDHHQPQRKLENMVDLFSIDEWEKYGKIWQKQSREFRREFNII